MERYLLKETAPFVQLSSVKITDDFNPLFDIEKIPDETLQSYCEALFHKAISINNSNIPAFINHHCNLVQDPVKWINKFEKLLSVNEEIFHELKKDSKLTKFILAAEKKRDALETKSEKEKPYKPQKRFINAESEERYFSIREVQNTIKKMDNLMEKIYFIMQEKIEYNFASIDFVNPKLASFSDACDELINELQRLHEIEQKIKSQKTLEKSHETFFPKIRINLNLNQFVTIFYDLQREYFVEGKPAIDAETNQIVDFICKNFLDKDGNEISPQSVRTMLLPSKPEKRPKGSKRIDLDDML